MDDIDVKILKQVVNEITLAEAKCMEQIHSMLVKENMCLKSKVVEEIAVILKKWTSTPPIEILHELEDLENSNNST